MPETPPRANVLLVDDQPNNLIALRAILEPLGQNLVEARSGREALRHLLDQEFAVILLDVQMPDMDGMETAILIKQREKTRHIPILFLTANNKDDLDVFRGYSVGAVDYIFKPLNADVLRSKVSVFIELHRKNEKIRHQAELLRQMRERDIEDLRRASEHRYRNLADSMPQIVWTATATGHLVYRNRRWYECAAVRSDADQPEEMLGWDAVLHPDDVAPFERRWAAAVKSGEDWNGEYRFGSRTTGVYRWHLVRVLGALDTHGNRSWVGTSTDIDDQKRAAQALLAANRAKDEFLAVLSHELRTPLNSILGWANLLRGGDLDEKKRARALETIERNARAQAELIADLLDVSRIVSGKLSLELGPLAVRMVVEQAVEAARPAATAAGVRLEVDYGTGVDEVNGDPDRLRQVALNLISNAIKFTPAGGMVGVSLDRQGDAVRIVVQDTGKGIEPSFLPHVFERFRQAADATTRPHGGLGLGLAIVQHLVGAHGGSVKAESEGPGKGARFIVTLPILGGGIRPVRRSDEQLSVVEGIRTDALSGISVLVVEDDDDGRALLELVLREFGGSVTAASTAAAAFDAVKGGGYDIILSDIGLPHEDGYALLKRIRELEGDPIPAVALTAYASRDDRARAIAAGFDAHIAKPVEPQALVTAVASLARPRMERRSLVSGVQLSPPGTEAGASRFTA